MKIGDFDTDEQVLVIAEIGNNHEGSFELASKLINLAKETGVDAVKFQTYKTELYTSPVNQDRIKRLKQFELSFEQFSLLRDQAKDLGLIFISTPLDLDSARFLNGIVDAIKIGSGENTFYPLISLVANFAKPIIMSTGLANFSEIQYSKSLIQQTWSELGVTQQLAILHCVSAYPTPPKDANIRFMDQLECFNDCTIGYSDHTLGTDAALIAVGRGARIVEKHFTIDKNYSDFRDHQVAADPAEMKELVSRIRNAQDLLGQGQKRRLKVEEPTLPVARRTIVALKDLEANHVLGWEDLNWTRPQQGLAPGQENLVLGLRLKCAIKAGMPIKVSDLVR